MQSSITPTENREKEKTVYGIVLNCPSTENYSSSIILIYDLRHILRSRVI